MRHLSTLALAGLFGGLLLVGDASACHKKKAVCACPPPAPAPVVCAAPKVKHAMKMPKMGCHKKVVATCETYAPMTYAPTYAAPMMAPSPQAPMMAPSPQGSGQGM